MARCHDNRRKRERRATRAAVRIREEKHRRNFELPPGYAVASRNYGFALYRGSWANGIRHDARLGGFEEYESLLSYAWRDYEKRSTSNV